MRATVRRFKPMEIIVVLESELIEQGWETRPTMGFNELVGPIWARRDGDGWVNGFLVTDKHLNSVATSAAACLRRSPMRRFSKADL